jgi:hypothetical protein
VLGDDRNHGRRPELGNEFRDPLRQAVRIAWVVK